MPGTNVARSSDDSLFARVAGIVTFEWVTRGKKQISVYPKVAETKEAKKEPAKKAAPKAAKKPAAAIPAAKKAPAKAKKAETDK